MRVISFNANGIRAAARKGFFDWLLTQDADVVCIQETKAQEHQLKDDPTFYPEGYHCTYFDASSKKGYSGVAIYSRQKPDEIITGIDSEEFDAEGRYIEAKFGDLSVISLYLPSGSSSEERQAAKYRFLDHFMPQLKAKRADGRTYIVCGDWNIAHKEIDLKNWKGNKKNSGFLPEERAWLDELFDNVGWVDSVRSINPEEPQYTWWSNRGRARENNVGWRIDYQVVTPDLADKITGESVFKDEWYSDHAPLIVDYELS